MEGREGCECVSILDQSVVQADRTYTYRLRTPPLPFSRISANQPVVHSQHPRPAAPRASVSLRSTIINPSSHKFVFDATANT